MAESYFPFDAGPGANINESQWRDLMLANGAPTPGVIAGFENELEVFGDSTAGFVKVRSGRAGCFGHTYLNSGTISLAVPNNATGQRRVDQVVVEFDFVNNTASTKLLQGGTGFTQDKSTKWHILIGYSLSPVGTPPIIAAANAVACLDRYATSNVDTPIGSGIDYYLKEAAVPKGWALARGQTLSVYQVPKMWGVMLLTGHGLNVSGSEWGLDTPNEQIKLPDTRGRASVGVGNMGGSDAGRLNALVHPNGLGRTGGLDVVQLTGLQVGSHFHGVSIGSSGRSAEHLHYAADHPGVWKYVIETPGTLQTLTLATGSTPGGSGNPISSTLLSGIETVDHTHSVIGNTASSGAGDAHENMPPYVQCNKIIRLA